MHSAVKRVSYRANALRCCLHGGATSAVHGGLRTVRTVSEQWWIDRERRVKTLSTRCEDGPNAD